MATTTSLNVPVVDIRSQDSNFSLVDEIHRSLSPTNGSPRSLPTLLLYDEAGLKLFEDITYLDDYYLTNAEIEALHSHSAEIAARIPDGSRIVELGSGNLRKVMILLDAFEKAQKHIQYYALDVSLPELERTFSMVDISSYHYVKLNGLYGTYDDGLAWLAEERKRGPRGYTTCVMSLGSSIGNFMPNDAASFLAGFATVLDPADYMLIGVDACQDLNRVFQAYNDSEGVTEDFYRNALCHANRLLGHEAFKQCDWQTDTNVNKRRHQAAYVALRDIKTKDLNFNAGERLPLEVSCKYSTKESDVLWRKSELIPQMSYANKTGDYNLHLLSPARLKFADKAVDYAGTPVPSLEDWRSLWQAWDTASRAMVSKDELMSKPIQLRNNLIFYLGHIPTFADIHFTRATHEKATEPASYPLIFERGIDPDVDNPEICHAHSEIPDAWPPLQEILDYSVKVRSRIVESMQTGHVTKDRRLARGLWLAYEHEAMHLETFLYMLIHSDKILPPPAARAPDFANLAARAAERRTENDWHHVLEAQLTIGLNDPEDDLGSDRYFGWDVERPARSVTVKAFEAQGRPISNSEYAYFLETTQSSSLPASWMTQETTTTSREDFNGISDTSHAIKVASAAFVDGKLVRTVYGPVPLKFALDWPVMASFDELAAYAKWAGGRIPTLEEVRTIYKYAADSKQDDLEKIPSKLISAVNGHLINEGVQETPPSHHSSTNGAHGVSTSPKDLFVDLSGCNVGFKNWHPTPVTDKGSKLCGQGDVGGLWEWTSTLLAPFDGYKPMDLYPGYSADFFDGKHNICVGGSWATVPRIAGRKSFVNWYQHNYPYVWCTARLVRDVA